MRSPRLPAYLESVERAPRPPLEYSLLIAVAVFRWATLAWAVLVVVADNRNGKFGEESASLPLAILLVGLMAAFTLGASLWLRIAPAALLTPGAVVAELMLGAAVVFFDNAAYSTPHTQSLGSAWPLAGIFMAGILWAGRGGFVAGLAIGMARVLGQLEFLPNWWLGQNELDALGTIVLYSTAGAVGGFLTIKLREAEQRISAAKAREEVSRQLHDGVLQTLAVIQRRSDDPELVSLARDQEEDLRAFLFHEPGSTGLVPSLRDAASRFTRLFGGIAQVVAVIDPDVDGDTRDAIKGAVIEALNNAGKHGHARSATIFIDTDGNGDVFCSIKDDGDGFDHAHVDEGVGISRSIRGRIEEVGGRVEIDGRLGQGTEVRLWVPA
jgi:signal transduction histidine kinase